MVPDAEQMVQHISSEELPSTNPSGDSQINVDILLNDYFRKGLLNTGCVGSLVSEEDEAIHPGNEAGEFSVVMDPCDGSSNVERGWPSGLIVGLVRGRTLYQPARNIEATVIVQFGSRTFFMYAVRDHGAHLFRLDKNMTFRPYHEHVTLPANATFLMLGGHRTDYNPSQRLFFDKFPGKSRWSGCLAADTIYPMVDRNGSIFVYQAPKLRVLYEILPIALLVREAAGLALGLSDGRIVQVEDLISDELGSKCGFAFGSRNDVCRFASCTN